MTADVLVIDDSATIRKLVEMSLRGSPFQAHFAQCGAEGVEQARALRPAAILLDCVLPDVPGLEVCRQLAADERTRAIPILLITARASQVRDQFQGFPAVVDFLGKPFSAPDLLSRLGRAVAIPAPRRFTRGQQERAARILYARLREGLALIPSYMTQLGASPPAAYFARRLLTPEVMEAVLGDLMELCEEIEARGQGGSASRTGPRGSFTLERAGLAAGAPRRDGPSGAAPAVRREAVLDRVPGFSERVRQTRLSSTARRVLTLVDGIHTVAEICRRGGLDEDIVSAVAHDLITAGLLQDRTSAVDAQRPRPVVIFEPDVQGFQRPLASLLETRADPHALVAVTSVDEVIPAVRRVHPCMVVVNATGVKSGVSDAARHLRADQDLADVALIAVLDVHDRSNAADLYSAGFDAVLNKPIIFTDLERFIAVAPAR